MYIPDVFLGGFFPLPLPHFHFVLYCIGYADVVMDNHSVCWMGLLPFFIIIINALHLAEVNEVRLGEFDGTSTVPHWYG